MSVSYVARNSSPTAAQLDALVAELDAILTCLYAGKTPLLYESGFIATPNEFFFGDDAAWKIIPLVRASATLYDHTTFNDEADALTVDNYDSALELANVELDGAWPLDGSLEAHKVDFSGTTYFYNQKFTSGKQGSRERYLRLDVADIVLEAVTGAALTWDSEFDRYHCLRFHNLDPNSVTVTLPGSVDVVIPAFGIKSVRRSYPADNTWDQSYNYLWKPESGDLLFWDGVPGNPVGSVKELHRIIDAITSQDEEGRCVVKPSVLYDGSAYLDQALDDAEPLYKYKFHVGPMVVVQSASGAVPSPTLVTPTWSSIVAGTGGIKLNTTTFTLQADTGASTPVDVSGIGSTLAPVIPVTLPHTIDFTMGYVACLGAEEVTTTRSGTYYDGYSTPPGSVPINPTTVETDITYATQHTASWQIDTGTNPQDYTLADAKLFEDAAATELTTKPSISLASDGWRLMAYGTLDWPADIGILPNTLAGWDVGETSLTFYFGQDLLARSGLATEDLFQITHRNYGRKYSAYAGYESGGTTYYEGHPDLTGHYGLAGGIHYTQSRVEPTASGIDRTESPECSTTVPTLTTQVTTANDTGERIAANYTDATWWHDNRTDLLAGVITPDDEQTLIRFPILALHYNHVAQRLNSIHWIVPFTIDSVVYYGFGEDGLNDRTWPIAHVPSNWECGVLATGSRADELGLTISGSGTESHLTFSTVATWADSLGLRYFRRRIRTILDSSGDYTRDDTETRRGDTDVFEISGFCEDYYGAIVPQNSNYQGALGAVACLAAYENVEEFGVALPSGWEFPLDDIFLTVPTANVAYIDDPHDEGDAGQEELEVVSAVVADPTIWPIAEMPSVLTPQAVADIYTGLGTIDDRCAWRVLLGNRFLIVRQ